MHLVAHRRAWDQQVALLLSGSQPPLSVGPHITQSRCTCNAIHGVQTSTRHQKAVGALGNQTHLTGCLTTSQTPYQQQKMPDIRFSPSFPPFSAPWKEVNCSRRRPSFGQQGPHRLRKSIIDYDGSDLIAPRDGAAVQLASSSRAVRCRRLPIAYRLLVAHSDVAAAKQVR